MENIFPAIDPVVYAMFLLVVAGGIEFVKSLWRKEYEKASIIAAAAVFGGLVASGIDGLTVLSGVALGVQLTGFISVSQLIAKKFSGAQG